MTKLVIFKKDKSVYWTEHFNSFDEGLAWLKNEMQQKYWDKEYTFTLEDKKRPWITLDVKDGLPVAVIDAGLKLEKELDNRISRQWVKLRLKRNQLLWQTDFTQLLDAPLTVEKKQEYAEYRQLLRDLPAVIEDIDNVQWPEKP
jgi:hypothetical protein